ncbi:MAG: acyltransferase family protein [Bacteroidales bacterium]|nr:acyltransferase family protein [Bacteroidales bacterium]
MKTRIYFLDNLRTVLIFLVVLLHAGIIYEPILESIWIVSDPVKNSSLGLVRMYLDLFVMFNLFFISGYFIPLSVENKTAWDFLKSKFKRIMLPWIVAVFTLIPAYKAIFLYSRGLPQEEWFSYFHFFQRAGGNLGFFADNPTQNWLWFLPVIFLFQVFYLALSRANLLSLKISLKTGVLLTFIIGLIYSLVISTAELRGWFHSPLLHFQRERLLVYFMVFLLGSLCYKLNVFESQKKNRKYYILSNVVLTISLGVFTAVALNFFFNIINPERNYYFVSELIDRILYYISVLLSMLSFLYILIHVFRFNFNKSNSLMSQINKNSYSVYIIHIIVLGVFALILINIPIPAFIKYFILTTLTFIVCNIIIYGYRRLFQTNTSLKLATLAVLVVTLFAFINYGNKENSTGENKQASTSQSVITPPKAGLHEAALQGNIEAIRQHIKAGSNLDEKDPSGGSSPLITATVFGKSEVALALIEAGADVNYKNNEGSTPLHTAAFFCRKEIVEALLTNGADKNIKNNAGSTALESVTIPFEAVKGIYDYFGKLLGPMGLELDYEQIKITRPRIAKMLY